MLPFLRHSTVFVRFERAVFEAWRPVLTYR